MTRFVPAIVVVIGLLWLIPALIGWKAADDARRATPVGSATFHEITLPPYPEGVLTLTGEFDEIDRAGARAWFGGPFEFVDPIPTSIREGDRVQVTCRVRWVSEGIAAGSHLHVDVCRDIVRLSTG